MKFSAATATTSFIAAFLLAAMAPCQSMAKQGNLRNRNSNNDDNINVQRSLQNGIRILDDDVLITAQTQIAFASGPASPALLGSSIIITGDIVNVGLDSLLNEGTTDPPVADADIVGTSSQVCMTTASNDPTTIMAHQCTITDEFFRADGTSLGTVMMEAGGKYEFAPSPDNALPPTFDAAIVGGTGIFEGLAGTVTVETLRERDGTPGSFSGFIVLRHDYNVVRGGNGGDGGPAEPTTGGPCEVSRVSSRNGGIEMRVGFNTNEAVLDFGDSRINLNSFNTFDGSFEVVSSRGDTMVIQKKRGAANSITLSNPGTFEMESSRGGSSTSNFRAPTCVAMVPQP